MISVFIICVGKNKEKYYDEAFREYVKRLSPICMVKLLEVPEYRLSDRPGAKEIDKALAIEAEAIRKVISKGSKIIALCIEGKSFSSSEFAGLLNDSMISGNSAFTFVIGGSYGLSESIKKLSDLKLSMSSMTFPHHLARIMLIEQIYRAFQILEGAQYHK
jgi:23S rRNA (pseudouridine1915-N3)-methyltransferase